jgi:hypothetical protein
MSAALQRAAWGVARAPGSLPVPLTGGCHGGFRLYHGIANKANRAEIQSAGELDVFRPRFVLVTGAPEAGKMRAASRWSLATGAKTMNWIETEDGYVNLATAQRIGTNSQGNHIVVDQDGESHKLPDHIEPEVAIAPIVPDTRGTVLHEIWYEAGSASLGGKGATWYETHFVVGWRVTAGYQGAQPIIPGKKLSSQSPQLPDYMVVIEMPDGSMVELGDEERHESLDAARQALFVRRQK